MNGTVQWFLQIALQLINIFVRNAQRKNELETKIKTEIERYKQGVGDAARVQDEHKKLDDKLEEEWEKKFGTKPTTSTTVTEVKVLESFLFMVSAPQGKVVEVWAEKQYMMGTMGWNQYDQKYTMFLAFNQPGVRVLTAKIDGEWQPTSTTITVRPV